MPREQLMKQCQKRSIDLWVRDRQTYRTSLFLFMNERWAQRPVAVNRSSRHNKHLTDLSALSLSHTMISALISVDLRIFFLSLHTIFYYLCCTCTLCLFILYNLFSYLFSTCFACCVCVGVCAVVYVCVSSSSGFSMQSWFFTTFTFTMKTKW